MKITLNLAPSMRLDNSERAKQADKPAPTITFDFQQHSNRVQNEMISARKNAARARMAQLKQQIEAMMQFAHIGKGNPQQIARLAKELKALVAEYGGGGAVSVPSIPVSSAETASTENAATSSDASGGDKNSDSSSSESKETAATSATTAAASGTTSDGKNNKTGADASKSDEKKAGGVQHTTPSKEDDAFYAEAKKLALKLKQLLAMQNRKLETELDAKEMKRAKEALGELDKTIAEAEQASMSSDSGAADTTYSASGSVSVSGSDSISVYA